MNKLKEVEVNKSSDQYSQYERLPVLLKRFSFKEKMRMSTDYSSEVILFAERMHQLAQKPTALPWCLETFVMLSVEANEYKNGDFIGKNENKFISMYNAIWKATSFVTELSSEKFSFIDFFLPATALTQFHLQEVKDIKQYRYWKIFNDNSVPVYLKDIFKAKLGADYNDFLLLGHILQLLFIAQSDNKRSLVSPEILPYLLYEKFPDAAKKLIITRSDYVTLQNNFTDQLNKPYSYLYSLCPSYQYAFILEDDRLYLPLPHLLNQNITSSLMFRLTEGDNKLRRDIGKHIWERYLFDLVNDTGIYEEVFPEQIYKYKGTDSSSPDILARQDKNILFIDSKSTVPSVGIRLFDDMAYEDNIRIVADNIKKLYHQIDRFLLYNPFSGEISQSKEDFWGIVVVLEDAYILRKRYYEKAAEFLNIEEDSDDWKWLVTHIKVVSLYEIESICFCGFSLIDAFKHAARNNPYDYPFSGYVSKGSSFIDKKFLQFQEKIDEDTNKIIDEMKELGFLR